MLFTPVLRTYSIIGMTYLVYITLKCCLYFVVDPGKGGCADPVNGGAILGKGGAGLKGGNKERQLSPDKERDKT